MSQVGTWLQNAAQAWLILQLTHSAAAVGVLGFCLYLPYALFGLLGGALADRWDRRRSLIVTQSGLALAAAALAAGAYLRVDSVIVVDTIALARGTILSFNSPSRQALMVQLVGRRDLPNAIALNSSLNNATRVVGPAIAGVLIANVGVGACFALNAVSFLGVIAALALMRPAEFHAGIERVRGTLAGSIGAGLVFARRRKTILIVLLMLAVISTVSINFNVVLPILAAITLHGGPQTYGIVAAAFGLGAVGGAFITAGRRRASPALLLLAAAGFGAAQLAVATQRSLPGVALALVATGVCYTIYTASSNAIVQLATPARMQGRVGGLYNYVFIATGPLGSLIAGGLANWGGAPAAFIAGGIAALVMAVAGWCFRPWPMPAGSVQRSARVRRRTTSTAGFGG